MKEWALDKDRVIHSIKTALACLIGFIITKSAHLPVDQWLIITILVVMCAQINVGSMIQKSYMRFLGTLLGSLVAALTLIVFGVSDVITGFVLTFSAMLFSYISTSESNIGESGTLGAVTTTIILISPHPTLMTAIGRFFEITAGIVIAALVSQFVLPIHARTILRRKQIKTIRQLRSYYLATFLTNQHDKSTASYHEIDVTIIKSLIVQRKLAAEAIREPFAKNAFVVTQFTRLISCEREMQRSITFMHHAYKSSLATKELFSTMVISHDFHDKICNAFDAIATHMEKKIRVPLTINIPSVQVIKNIVISEKNNLSDDDTVYINGFLFCAEILVARLSDIVKLINNQ